MALVLLDRVYYNKSMMANMKRHVCADVPDGLRRVTRCVAVSALYVHVTSAGGPAASRWKGGWKAMRGSG